MTTNELRQKYLDFFKSKDHKVITSASLIPENDPTVLFNTAGMQPLVPYLLGETHPAGTKLVNIQKCLRTVDFDNIGDDTHNTFFQMLGNWSLGDYFKEESIKWSFEFLTSREWLNLPLEKLAFTVYQGGHGVPKDEESFCFWENLGVSEDRIAYWGEDNFWSAGETGPCGPSSEIFYWTGDEPAPDKYDPNDETWVEIWNNVFMAYNKEQNGELNALKNKNVDTGMGFERTLAVLNGKKSAYETELFEPIIKEIEKISSKDYLNYKKEMRIISDHIRAIVFLIGDQNGITPSNADQGYILRRLIRRSIRIGKVLEIEKSFMSELAMIVIDNYGDFYTELKDNKDRIVSELEKEEEKFRETLEKGMKEFRTIIETRINGVSVDKKLASHSVFTLYTTYGFPIELIVEMAKEKGLEVDIGAFERDMKKHQDLSRAGAEQKFKGGLADTGEMSTKYHTATHLLHSALRKVLGDHVEQKGSNITGDRLRFDFTHTEKMTPEQKIEVEKIVNEAIDKKLSISMQEMTVEEAKDQGAIGLFGDKYEEKVKVYTIGTDSEVASKEICGGPHVESLEGMGYFKIKKEESSSSGVRRIKAILE
jgi:alanyl-tRNA synthetase